MPTPEMKPVAVNDGKGTVTYGAGLTARSTLYAERVTTIGPAFEVIAEKNGYFASGEVGAGYNGAFAGAKIGKEWNVNKNLSLELSGNADYSIGFKKGTVAVAREVSINDQNNKPLFADKQSNQKHFNPAVFAAGVTVMPKFETNNKKFELGAGFTAQYVKNNGREVVLPPIEVNITNNEGHILKYKDSGFKLSNKQEDFVMSPVFSIKYKPTDKISIAGHASVLDTGVTATWKF